MMPLSDVVAIDETSTAKTITHFNLFRSAEINGSAAPGFSSGQALQSMEELSNRVLPQGFTFAWSGQSLEETKSGRQSTYIFGLGLLLVYLTLAAQDESITLPFIILLSVPLAIMGALARAVGARTHQRRLLPDRARDADRPLGEERHSHRGVRRAAPGARHDHRAGRRRSGAHPAPSHPDDVIGVHSRRHAARHRDRRGPCSRVTRSAPRSSVGCWPRRSSTSRSSRSSMSSSNGSPIGGAMTRGRSVVRVRRGTKAAVCALGTGAPRGGGPSRGATAAAGRARVVQRGGGARDRAKPEQCGCRGGHSARGCAADAGAIGLDGSRSTPR